MGEMNAIIFVPKNTWRCECRCSIMAEKLLFTPLGRWMSDALSSAGVKQFFVVFQDEVDPLVQALFPEGTEFVDRSTDSPEVLLHNFLIRQDPGDRTLVLTRPLFLTSAHLEEIIATPMRTAERPVYRFDSDKRMSRSGMFSVNTELFMQELRSGKGFDLIGALLSVGDPICESAPVIGDVHALMAAVPLAQEQVSVRLLKNGVNLVDSTAIWICPHTSVGPGTTLYPGTIIAENCTVGSDCVIGPDAYLEDAVVESGAKVISSRVTGVTVSADAVVGPYCALSPEPPAPELPPEQPEKNRRKLGRKEKINFFT